MSRLNKHAAALVGCMALALGVTATAHGARIRVTVQSLAPADGTLFTPVWVGFHDGSFDLFDNGAPASAALQSLAEDGDFAGVSADFAAASGTSADGAVFGPGAPPVFPPSSGGHTDFVLDAHDAASRYLSFAAMLLPSNDAFFANDNAMAYEIFDASGTFHARTITILGSQIWDAGTELNDEIAANVPVLGQAAPNTGSDEGALVHAHPGFMPGGNILAAFPGADFTQPGYAVARISVSAVPLPGSVWLLLGGLSVIAGRRAARRA